MDNISKRLEKLLKDNKNINDIRKLDSNKKNLVILEHRGYNSLSISDDAKERITYNRI